MFYVIQTNTSLTNDNKAVDFQNCSYKISDKTWEEFKNDILSENQSMEVKTTMGTGKLNPKHCCKIKQILINDDFHLEAIKEWKISDNKIHGNINVKYYMISAEAYKSINY
jgi:hypothetical protein